MASSPVPDAHVFLSASADDDTSAIRGLLRSHGFGVVTWEELPRTGLAGGLADVLEGCDALLAQINGPDVAPAVLMEIGAALGRRLPVILLTTGITREQLPPALRELPSVAVSGLDLRPDSALARRLLLTIDATQTVQLSQVPPLGQIEQRAGRIDRWPGSLLSDRTSAILRDLGARTVDESRRGPGDVGADIAAWIDGLPHPMLNPVLVETKTHPAPHVEEQLQQMLIRSQTLLGIVVTEGAAPPKWTFHGPTAIATLGIEHLADLTLEGLVDLLTTGRNQWAHGPR